MKLSTPLVAPNVTIPIFLLSRSLSSTPSDDLSSWKTLIEKVLNALPFFICNTWKKNHSILQALVRWKKFLIFTSTTDNTIFWKGWIGCGLSYNKKWEYEHPTSNSRFFTPSTYPFWNNYTKSYNRKIILNNFFLLFTNKLY